MLAEVIGNGIDSTYMQNRATLVETSPVSLVQTAAQVPLVRARELKRGSGYALSCRYTSAPRAGT